VVRLRHKGNQSEELVVIVRVAPDPWVSISHKGLTIEVPITVTEAVQGARIQVPTLDEPTLVSVEPGTQSGTEVRLRERGITYRDGTRGDLFVRFMIRVPETPGVVGLREVASALSPYYEHPVRRHLPKQI
jgi:DnaJ-class molecular chaperone